MNCGKILSNFLQNLTTHKKKTKMVRIGGKLFMTELPFLSALPDPVRGD